jgi:hypothetical protein
LVRFSTFDFYEFSDPPNVCTVHNNEVIVCLEMHFQDVGILQHIDNQPYSEVVLVPPMAAMTTVEVVMGAMMMTAMVAAMVAARLRPRQTFWK